jgi:hypothetical protein
LTSYAVIRADLEQQWNQAVRDDVCMICKASLAEFDSITRTTCGDRCRQQLSRLRKKYDLPA